MVKNRNYQVRVEESAARRKEAKDRKKWTEERRHFKAIGQEFLKKLDASLGPSVIAKLQAQNNGVPLLLHVWTDSRGSLWDVASPSCYDNVDDDTAIKKKVRDRSGSLDNQWILRQNHPKPKGRLRSNSVPSEAYDNTEKGYKGKQPKFDRTTTGQDGCPNPLLCRSHFFFDRCALRAPSASSGRRKTNCRLVHLESNDSRTAMPQLSLFESLHGGPSCAKQVESEHEPHVQQELFMSDKAAADSLPESMTDSDPGGMEMVYHSQLSLVLSNDQEDQESPDLGSRLCWMLQNGNLSLSNIVYVSLGRALLYDRNREGWLLPAQGMDVFAAVLGVAKASIRRKESIGSEYSQEELQDLVVHLTGPVLEHVLTFLPDLSVASVSRVCRAWNREIGQNSPELWRHMLQRRQWPLPVDIQDRKAEMENLLLSEAAIYRREFIKHYTLVRNMKAVKQGVAAILTKKPQPGAEKEMSYQDFSARQNAPPSLGCVSLQTWSDNLVLAAYESDCSLRLFESSRTNGSSLLCKEVICRRVDPTQHTRRMKCDLKSMQLDDKYIVSLLTQSAADRTIDLLVVLSRHSYLCGEAMDGSAALTEELYCIVEVGDILVKYLLANSELLDTNFLQVLLQFLASGGEPKDVVTEVTPTLASLGKGLFLLEVTIFEPVQVGNMDDNMVRKLVVFSVESGGIVSVADSPPESSVPVFLYVHEAKKTPACTFVSSDNSSTIFVGKLGLEGLDVATIDTSMYTGPDLPGFGFWCRRLAMTSTTLICADTYYSPLRTKYKSVLSFYSSWSGEGGLSYSSLSLFGHIRCHEVICLDEEYALLLCSDYTSARPQTFNGIEMENDNPEDQRALHPTTAGGRVDGEYRQTIAILVHVKSRRELYREQWIPKLPQHSNLLLRVAPIYCSANHGDSLAVALSSRGIVMTGCSIRAPLENPSISNDSDCIPLISPCRSPKKKKQGKAARNSKKDGLVRGKRMYF